ncbi:phage antirepressor KilAC domain-containing protein [Clostridium isatidis]|uniref:phage antirepressor KilAC domain-containing protein n=1 Tax=Clostridium isatidis TaxID=182773 RepID=UPI003AAA7D63
MNQLMKFENKEVEVFELNGQVLFNPYHCGECLGLSPEGVRKAITRMNEKQVIKLKNSDVTIGNIRKLNNAGENFLTESGVYKLIFKSKKEAAEKFQDWVTDEVLPSIRKHGMYAQDELLNNPDLLIAAATKLKEERQARLEAEKQRDKLIHQNKLYTTSEIAKELGLSSATKLNNLLAERKIQYKQNKTWLLYSKYSELGLVSIKQEVLDNGKIIYDRKWTGKGRDFILNLFEGVI